MMGAIVDSHQHFWEVGRFDYPWMSPDLEVLYRNYLPPMLRPALDRCGVEKTVLVQASNSLAETRWLLRLADQYPFIAGVVGWIDLMSSDAGRQLNEFTVHPKFKGVRHLVESEPNDEWLIQGPVLEGLQLLSHRGLSYDVLVHPRHLGAAKKVAEACPDLRLVIDHMAKPPIARGEVDSWARDLQGLAAFPNVACKLSGLVTEADHASWRTSDLKPCVDAALECFGPKRMMFGSDWPVCLLAATYDRVLEATQSLLAGLDEEARSCIFSKNASEFYRLQPQARAA